MKTTHKALAIALLLVPSLAAADTFRYRCYIRDNATPDNPWDDYVRLQDCRFIDPIVDIPITEPVLDRSEGRTGRNGRQSPGDTSGCDQAAENSPDSAEIVTDMPVVIPTGAKLVPETDFVVDSEEALGIGRNYFSKINDGGAFGRRWASSIDQALIFYQGSSECSATAHLAGICAINPALTTRIVLRRPGGGRVSFDKVGSNWQSNGHEYSLAQSGSDWVVWQQNGRTETYTAIGQATTSRNAHGIGWNFIYNASNTLSQITHTNGQSMSFTWTNGRVTQVIAPGGGVYSYSYSPQGYLQTVTSPAGTGQTTRSYHYEVSGKPHLLTGYSINGVRTTRYAYDSSERVTSSGLESGQDKSTFVYGTDFTRVTNAVGLRKTYSLNENKQVTGITRDASPTCATGSISSTFGADARMSTEVDAAGNVTRYHYTSLGRLRQKDQGETTGGDVSKRRITVYDWNATETQLIGIREYGHTVSSAQFLRETQYEYYPDTAPAPLPRYIKKVTHIDRTASATPNRVTTYTYSFHGNSQVHERREDGPLAGTADTVTYRYASTGALTHVINVLGQTHTLSNHTPFGQPTWVTDPNGLLQSFTYDTKGRTLTATIAAAGGNRVTTYEYDANGNVTKVVDPSGRTTNVTRDLAGNATQFLAPSAHPMGEDGKDIRNLTYDNIGQLRSNSTRQSYLQYVVVGWSGGEPIMDYVLQSQEFHSVQQTYDSAGFLSSTTGNNGQSIRRTYDSTGSLSTVTDSLNQVASQTYDTHGRLKSVTSPNLGVVSFEYNPLGWITKATDRNGVVTQYEYNGFGDALRVISPDSGTTLYTYNAAGKVLTQTRADGTVTTYTRDALGRPLTESSTWAAYHGGLPSTVNTYVYDSCTNGIGRLCQFTDATGSTSYTYLTTGELASQTTVIDGVSFALSFTYDLAGRLRTTTYPNGTVLRYSYATDNRIVRIEAQVSGIWKDVVNQAVYRPFGGQLMGLGHGNGLNRQIDYDQDGRVTKIYGAGTTHPQNLTISYNANDLITGIVNSKNSSYSQTFGYNAMNELTSANSAGTGNHSWQYDANGNRTSHTWGGGTDSYAVTPGTNRLASIGGPRPKSLVYDANGSLRLETKGGVTVERHYNGFNRMVALTRPTNQTVPRANGTNVTLPAGTWQYRYNALGQRAYKNRVGTSTTTRYLFSPGGLLLGETNPGSGALDSIYVWMHGRPVGLIRLNAVFAIHTDQVGRPEVVTNPARTVVWRAANFAFDRIVTVDAIGGLSLGFPGQQYDGDADTWYNQFREYDATTGRYTTSDPLGMLAGVNPYTYARSNPVSLVDPFGLCVDWFGLAFGSMDTVQGGMGVISGGATTILSAFGASDEGMALGLGIITISLANMHDGVSGVGTALDGIERPTAFERVGAFVSPEAAEIGKVVSTYMTFSGWRKSLREAAAGSVRDGVDASRGAVDFHNAVLGVDPCPCDPKAD